MRRSQPSWAAVPSVTTAAPLSDTTILSSLGAGSDHVDHVKTQLPYALSVAVLCLIGYIIIGICL